MAEKLETQEPEPIRNAPEPDPLLMRKQQLQQQLQQINQKIMELEQIMKATITQADRTLGALSEIEYQQKKG